MSQDPTSRKRFRGASHCDELPPWECDPSYGIVHPSGCSTCRFYMSHIAEAKAAHSTSIDRAFKDLDSQLDTYFFDGVAEGRRRQRADDQERLRDLERARNDSALTVSRLRSESHETGQQLSLVKSQLHLAQSERDALRKRLESLTKEKVDDSIHVEAIRDGLEVERMLLNPGESPAHFHAVSSVPSPYFSKPEDPSGSSTVSQISIPLPPPSLPISVPKNGAAISTISLPPRPTVEVIASSGAPDLRATAAFPSIRAPKTLRQLQYLMNRAHQPGNEDSLSKVKMLCAEAHQTPREEKTELQRYILANWRNPEPAASGVSVSPPPVPLLLPNQPLLPLRANNPRMEDSVEVWHTYLTTHHGSWPRGVRRERDGTPHLGDLKASRTVARLRPAIGENGDTTSRTEFMACAAQLFASPGMYQDLLRRNALAVAPVVSYKPYRATQFSITAAEVARHFAAAGVSVAEAVAELEPWAQEYQAAVVFPTGSIEPRYSRPHTNFSSSSKSPTAYRPRVRQYDAEDRFGWR
ncbi:hypothetical protein C8R44DRAFT_640776 [Mycena epipterygia]|nr:hypothetical protein C8R44DRAFT_640776 [Mycena epipterygia]